MTEETVVKCPDGCNWLLVLGKDYDPAKESIVCPKCGAFRPPKPDTYGVYQPTDEAWGREQYAEFIDTMFFADHEFELIGHVDAHEWDMHHLGRSQLIQLLPGKTPKGYYRVKLL